MISVIPRYHFSDLLTGSVHLVHYKGPTFKCRLGFRSDGVPYISKKPSGYGTAGGTQGYGTWSAKNPELSSFQPQRTPLAQCFPRTGLKSHLGSPHVTYGCAAASLETVTLYPARKFLNTEDKQLRITSRKNRKGWKKISGERKGGREECGRREGGGEPEARSVRASQLLENAA